MQLATGLWERSPAGDTSSRGFLTAYEIVGWGQRDWLSRPDDQIRYEPAPIVTRAVMDTIIRRQYELAELPSRFVFQRDSYVIPGGEAFPMLDRLTWVGDTIRVESIHVHEFDDGSEPDHATDTRYLAPDPEDGCYHLDELGWPMIPVDSDHVVRVVRSERQSRLDDLAAGLVHRVENGEIDFGTALTLRCRAERSLTPTANAQESPPTVTPSATVAGMPSRSL